ncbi:hypothetical protein [Onishia niordana]|uniref:hypothetical protein n=1 Tax=Onishia niordana TaxID=2508711 RepID=UPI00109F545C|nr:hypothetical protein [Halomonas niordiana]
MEKAPAIWSGLFLEHNADYDIFRLASYPQDGKGHQAVLRRKYHALNAVVHIKMRQLNRQCFQHFPATGESSD